MSMSTGPNNGAPGPGQPPTNNMMMGMPAPSYNPYQPFFPPQMPSMMPHPGFAPYPNRPEIESPPSPSKDKPELHLITLHPRGMPRPFDVSFPERRLPVCDRCKKNYKSRDLCRTRDGHKTLPWTTTYVAITIDNSCIVEGDDGKVSYADVPVVGILMDTPLMCLGPADGSMRSEPICKVCREKNYTRDYCRNTCRHTTPPWSTTYVKIVADTRSTEERSRFYSPYGKVAKRRKKASLAEDGEDGKVKTESDGFDVTGALDPSYEESESDTLKSDDLKDIHQSKTFLAAVSSKSVIIRWCERIQYPEGADQVSLETAFPPASSQTNETRMEPNGFTSPPVQAPAPGPPMNQLWEAFRAGAMWAQAQAGQAQGPMPPVVGYGAYMPPTGMPFPMGQPTQAPGDMGGSGWNGGMFGGYPAMTPRHGAVGSTPRSFRNKNPADDNGAEDEEGDPDDV